MAQTESTNAPVYKLANCRSAPAPYQSGKIHTKSRVRPGKKHRKSAPRGLKTTEKTSALRGRKTTEEKNTHTTTTTDTNPTAWGERSGGRSPGFRWRPPSIQPNLEVGGQPRVITVGSQETGDDDRCGARVLLILSRKYISPPTGGRKRPFDLRSPDGRGGIVRWTSGRAI